MNFHKHSDYEGYHAPFPASNSSWLRYDDDKMIDTFLNIQAKVRGTKLHEWAKETIDLGLKQMQSEKTIYEYVNDAIGFKMQTEVVLFYSKNFFGTADAISFRDNFLRIHDLKTGVHPASMDQLLIYAALFCLEYKIKPNTIKMELRIYQNDEINVLVPEPEDIVKIMDIIVHFDNLLNNIGKEGY